MEQPQINHYIWELTKVFAPVVITILAMWFIDNQGKKRWKNESYLKLVTQKEIEVLDEMFKIKAILCELLNNKYLKESYISSVSTVKLKLNEIIKSSRIISNQTSYLFGIGHLKDAFRYTTLTFCNIEHEVKSWLSLIEQQAPTPTQPISPNADCVVLDENIEEPFISLRNSAIDAIDSFDFKKECKI